MTLILRNNMPFFGLTNNMLLVESVYLLEREYHVSAYYYSCSIASVQFKIYSSAFKRNNPFLLRADVFFIVITGGFKTKYSKLVSS